MWICGSRDGYRKIGLVVRVADKAMGGRGWVWGACGGYLLLSSKGLTMCEPVGIITSLTYWRFTMDKLKTFIGSLIFMVPMLILMLAYFDCLVQ